MQKVFINDRPLIFTEDPTLGLSKKMLEYEGRETLERALSLLEQGFTNELILVDTDIRKAKADFREMHEYLEAAGGLIENPNHQFLFIYRNGKWDLPKGKIEEGEESELAARREIQEETGLYNLELIRSLSPTWHTYKQDGKRMLKQTFWYQYIFKGKEKPHGQEEENITAAIWLDKRKVNKALSNSYRSIREVVLSQNRIYKPMQE